MYWIKLSQGVVIAQVVVDKVAKLSPYISPSVRVEQLRSHWTNFYEILCLKIFIISVEKIQVSFQSDSNYRYFTWRSKHISDNISLSFS
jgi:hypothetical protein